MLVYQRVVCDRTERPVNPWNSEDATRQGVSGRFFVFLVKSSCGSFLRAGTVFFQRSNWGIQNPQKFGSDVVLT